MASRTCPFVEFPPKQAKAYSVFATFLRNSDNPVPLRQCAQQQPSTHPRNCYLPRSGRVNPSEKICLSQLPPRSSLNQRKLLRKNPRCARPSRAQKARKNSRTFLTTA